MSVADQKLDAIMKMNADFHNMVIEAQETYTDGIPIDILAMFFAVQVDVISKKVPYFPIMVIEEIKKKASKRKLLR